MSGNRQYVDEFRSWAVKRVIARGFMAEALAFRIGIPKDTLSGGAGGREDGTALCTAAAPRDSAEIRRLKRGLRRMTEENDILKKCAADLAKGVKAKYAAMRTHVREFRLVVMCRVLGVHTVATTRGCAKA